VGADSVRLGVRGPRKNMIRIDVLLALHGRKVEFAELPRGNFRDSVQCSLSERLQRPSHEGVHPFAGLRGEFAVELHRTNRM